MEGKTLEITLLGREIVEREGESNKHKNKHKQLLNLSIFIKGFLFAY